MLSSNDIASMFASQQSQFASQSAFAQQITANSGIPNNSLASWGAAPAQAPRQPSPFPNVHPMPPAFSYNPAAGMGGGGYGGGNRFASGMMSGAAGAASLGGMALGFTRFAGLVDPLAGAMAGYGAAGMGGAMMGAAAPLALGYAASRVGGALLEGGQQRMQTNQMLGANFSFMNPASRTGQGFSRQDASQIHSVVKSLGETPELMSSFQELNNLIPKLRGAGVFSGVKDAHEFNSRFKESVKTLRDMSKVLGTTMEEAAQFFQQSRQVGFTSPTAQKANALNVKFTSAITGMSTDQVFGMQAAGAGMASQMGIRRGVGARAVTNMAQQLQGGLNSGGLDQGLLEDLSGGLTGDEAMGGAATNLTGTLAALAKGTSFGKQSLLALTKFDKSGKAIGIDEERARRLQEGNLSWAEQKKIVSGFSKRQKMSAVSHMDSLSMEYAEKAGMSGFAAQVGQMRDRGYDDEAVRLELTKLTGSENISDALMQMEGQSSDQGDMKTMKDTLARNAQRRERRDPKAILQKIKTKLHRETLGKVEEVGSAIFDKMSGAYDQFWDDVFEDYSITLSKEGGEKLKNAFNSTGTEDMKKMFAEAQGGGIKPSVGKGTSFGDVMRAGAVANMSGEIGGGVFSAGKLALRGLANEVDWSGAGGSGLTGGAQYRDQMRRFGVGEGGTDESRDALMRARMMGLDAAGSAMGVDQTGIRAALRESLAGEGIDVDSLSASDKYKQLRNTLGKSLDEGIGNQQGFLGRAADTLSGRGGIRGALLSGGGTYAQIEAQSGGQANVEAAVAERLHVDAAQAKKMVETAKKAGGSFLDALAAQSGLGEEAVAATGSLAAQFLNNTAEQRSGMMKDADAELHEKLGGAGAALVKSRPKLKEVLMDDKKRVELSRALAMKSGTPEEEAARKKAIEDVVGTSVTHDELVTMSAVMGKMSGDVEGTKGVISKMSALQSADAIALHRDSVESIANSITGKEGAALKATLMDFSKATGDNYEEKRKAVEGSIGDIIAQAEKITDPKKKEEFLSGLGEDVRGAVTAGMGKGDAIRKAVQAGKSGGVESLKKFLIGKGVTEKEASDLAKDFGGKELREGGVAKIEAAIATSRLGAKDAAKAAGGVTTGDKDEKMLEVLNGVKGAIDLNSSILLVANKDITAAQIKHKREVIQGGFLETSDSKTNPTAPPAVKK